MLFDGRSHEDVEALLAKVGKNETEPLHVSHRLGVSDADATELLGIIEARSRNKKNPDVRFCQPDDVRFGTHADVARHRAKRLACDTLIEAGAGVGMHTLAFAATCKKVVAVEIDGRKAAYIKANLAAVGVTNVEVVEGDVMALADSLPKADVIFLDPARAPQEAARDFSSSFSPPLPQFIERFSSNTKRIAIELPPHMHDIPLQAQHELEYISVDGELRRLTAYFGTLVNAPRSAVVLPAGESVAGVPGALPDTGELGNYLFEVDEAVVAAGLTALAAKDAKLFSADKHVLLTSDKHKHSALFRNTLSVVAACPPKDDEIIRLLKLAGAGKVILRAGVAPQRYWAERKKYEAQLDGSITVHLFITREQAIIARKDRGVSDRGVSRR